MQFISNVHESHLQLVGAAGAHLIYSDAMTPSLSQTAEVKQRP